MKKELQIATANATIKVTIQATIVDKKLISNELRHIVNRITEDMVPILAKAPYINGYLHDVKVK